MHLAKYGSHQTTQTFEIVCCITWELANPPSVVPDLEREHRSRVHCNKSIKGLFMRRRVTQISTLTVVQERTIIGLYRNRSTGRSIRFSMGAPVSSTRIDSLLKISLFCPPFTLFLVSEISIDNFASDRFDPSEPEVAQPTWTQPTIRVACIASRSSAESQHRENKHFWFCCEFVSFEQLGHVSVGRIKVWTSPIQFEARAHQEIMKTNTAGGRHCQNWIGIHKSFLLKHNRSAKSGIHKRFYEKFARGQRTCRCDADLEDLRRHGQDSHQRDSPRF